jgi:arylsulfatase A-like enzyme
LKENGYATAISGKWHLPGSHLDPEYGWDEYSLLGGYMNARGLGIEWKGLWFSWSDAKSTFYDEAVIGENPGKYPALYWNGCVVENGAVLPGDTGTFAPDLCQSFALEFIRRNAGHPFFLYYPMVLPHDPWLGTPDPAVPGGRTGPGFDAYLRRVEYYLGELADTLKKLGIYKNTVVIFTADNATLANGKGSCSELGVRVPLVVFGGPVKARGVSDRLVDFTDIYPTILELAGIQLNATGIDAPAGKPDGKSFKPLLDEEPFQEKDFIFSFLDLERTLRTRDYMIDGSGGIWKCDPGGNLLDYEPLPENPATRRVRESLLQLMEGYSPPSADDFSERRLETARRNYVRGSHHPATMAAWRNGDEWMHHPRRQGK